MKLQHIQNICYYYVMKKMLFLVVVLFTAIAAILYIGQNKESPNTNNQPKTDSTEVSQQNNTTSHLSNINSSNSMNISSPAFGHNESIPSKYTCDGDNVSPPVTFSNIPEGTKSLALIVEDPDAPAGLWVHWLVWNIQPDTLEIPEDNVPAGAEQGVSSFERNDYGGPCPPDNQHRYFFKLYALDITLDLEPAATYKNDLEKAMEGHTLAKTELIGLYDRS